MRDERMYKLADVLINYSTRLKKGDKIYVEWKGEYTGDFIKVLLEGITKAGAVPFFVYHDDSFLRKFLMHTTEEQMKEYGELHLSMMKKMDAFLSIRGGDNPFDLSDVPPEKMALYTKYFWKPVHVEQRIKHTRWCVLRYPTNSMAQMAETSREAFEDFFFNVCTLDYSRLSKAMDPLVRLMEKTDKVRITAPDTDLSFSIKGIPVVKCDGKLNIPDGEIYTAPVRNSVNGKIRFNAPFLWGGTVYNNVTLTFKDGKIVDASCDAHTERLNNILNTDEGARFCGEFAIGLNPYIKKPMKDILFDEKIYGSIHLTPGNCYDNANNGNVSAVHLDFTLIQTKEYGGGEMYFDDCLVRKDGIFVHPELKDVLNEENLTQ